MGYDTIFFIAGMMFCLWWAFEIMHYGKYGEAKGVPSFTKQCYHRVSFFIEFRDGWIGYYWDPDELYLYLCPLPWCVFRVDTASYEMIYSSNTDSVVGLTSSRDGATRDKDLIPIPKSEYARIYGKMGADDVVMEIFERYKHTVPFTSIYERKGGKIVPHFPREYEDEGKR